MHALEDAIRAFYADEPSGWGTGLPTRLRHLLDAIPALIFLAMDPDCAQVYGNAATEALLRAPRGGNLGTSDPPASRQPSFDVLDAQGKPIAPNQLPLQRAAMGEEVVGAEFCLRFNDGSDAWLHGNAYPLRDVTERLRGAIGAFIDISLLKRAEAALASSNAALARLMAVASHDLRQPVQAMSLLLPALGRRVSNDVIPMVKQLETCVLVLSDQLTDLMDLGRVSAGVVDINYRTISIERILTRVVAPAVPQAEGKGISLRLHHCSALVRTDPLLAERILSNLIANAVKYTDVGGVLVGCRRRGNRLIVQVSDTGPGIAPEHLNAIWSEFYKVDQRATKTGVGLGLAIVDRTARLLGSSVSVRSTVGRGSTFSIDLPLA